MRPTDDASKAITRSKSSFLTSQVRLLSTPLQATQDSALSDNVASSLVDKLNKKIQSHNRLSFPLETQRHVIEQIDSLYWRDVLSAGLPINKAQTTVKKDTDLSASDTTLPEAWDDIVLDQQQPRKRRRITTEERHETTPEERNATEEPTEDSRDINTQPNDDDESPQAQRYHSLYTTLQSQKTRRHELHCRIAQYKQLQSLLQPFENPQRDIQPNLPTKDNKELAAELSKMRVLLARVGSKVQQADAPRRTSNESVANSDAQRLEAVLGLG